MATQDKTNKTSEQHTQPNDEPAPKITPDDAVELQTWADSLVSNLEYLPEEMQDEAVLHIDNYVKKLRTQAVEKKADGRV